MIASSPRTPWQDLLLKAALLPGAAALEAWEQWRSMTDLDDAPPGSYRLMPLIHRNLEPVAAEYSDVRRLTGIRRKTFVQNQLLFRSAADVLQSLQHAGIATMLLRGAALHVDYYHDAGVRPMRNTDIAVPENNLVDAAKLLLSQGWREGNPALSVFANGFRKHHASIAFRSSSDIELRLHWHVLPCCRNARTDEWFWSGSTPTEFYGSETRTLNASDQFLYACLAGLRWSYEPPFWRVADALTILRACGTIDADRFRSLAADQHLEFLLFSALKGLGDDFGVRIPEELLYSLDTSPVSRTDEYEFKCMTQPYRDRTILAWLTGCYGHHRRSGQGTLGGHLWRTLRWEIAPHVVSRVSALKLGTKLTTHPHPARPLPAGDEAQAHPRPRAAHRPTVLPG